MLTRVGAVGAIGGRGKGASLLAQARAYLGGLEPTHWLDFASNRALFAGEDIGTISDVTLSSGTLALSAAGHTISSISNVLVIPIIGAYPLTVMVEAIRTADSGAVARFVQLDNGSEAERANIIVSAVDAWRAQHATASVVDANMASGVTAAVGATFKTAARYEAGNMAVACNGTLGGVDAACATNVNPDTLRVGAGVSDVEPATGIIRKLAVFSGTGAINAQLQAMT